MSSFVTGFTIAGTYVFCKAVLSDPKFHKKTANIPAPVRFVATCCLGLLVSSVLGSVVHAVLFGG